MGAVAESWLCNPSVLDAFDFIERYLTSLSGKSPYTVSTYRDVLSRLRDNLNVPLEHATVPELHASLFEFSQYYSRGRLRIAKSALRGFLKYTGKKDWLAYFPNPRIKWLPPSGPKPNEIDRVLAACENNLEYAVVLVSYSLGGRPGAIFGDKKAGKPPAMVEDIDWENGTIRVIDKGFKPRVLVFQQRRRQTLETLHRYLNGRTFGPIFPLTRSGAYKMLVKIGARAGLNKPILDGKRQKNRNLCSNLLRHACGQNMYRQSRDIFLVQGQHGHGDIRDTLVYVQISQMDLIERAREREWR